MFVTLPAVMFVTLPAVIFWANASVGPKPLNTSMLAIVVMANVAAAATIAIATKNTFVFIALL
jgi:hypothetical protein